MLSYEAQKHLRFKTPPPPFPIDSIFPDLARLKKTAVRLHPVPCNDVPVHASKIGGTFLWADGLKWPESHEPQQRYLESVVYGDGTLLHERSHQNRTHVGVIQLLKSDTPELPFPPGKDVFQLFWNPRDQRAAPWGPSVSIYWHNSSELRPDQPNPRPEHPVESYLPKPCALHPERLSEYPRPAELPPRILHDVEKWIVSAGGTEDDYSDLMSAAPGIKLGGYPRWKFERTHPICSCGNEMSFVLAVDGFEFDGGSGPRWKPDIEGFDIDQPEMPTGLNVGRDGVMHLFLCLRCDSLPFQYVIE